jgi:hypothetical protein
MIRERYQRVQHIAIRQVEDQIVRTARVEHRHQLFLSRVLISLVAEVRIVLIGNIDLEKT